MLVNLKEYFKKLLAYKEPDVEFTRLYLDVDYSNLVRQDSLDYFKENLVEYLHAVDNINIGLNDFTVSKANGEKGVRISINVDLGVPRYSVEHCIHKYVYDYKRMWGTETPNENERVTDMLKTYYLDGFILYSELPDFVHYKTVRPNTISEYVGYVTYRCYNISGIGERRRKMGLCTISIRDYYGKGLEWEISGVEREMPSIEIDFKAEIIKIANDLVCAKWFIPKEKK